MHPAMPRSALAIALLATFATSSFAADTRGDAIVVTATRQAQRANDLLADVTVIDQEEIRQAGPSATITDLLARQPGLEITSRGGPGTSAGVMLRGSNSGHTLVLIDGLRVSSATLGDTTWGYLPLSQVERIEILRGPASSLYGADAVGGVVQIFTRRGEGAPQLTAEAGVGSWNTTAAKAGVSGSSGALSYSLQAADQRSDGFSAINKPKSSSYNPDKDGYAMHSASGSLAYALAADHEVGLNFLRSDGWNKYDSYPAARDYRQDQTVTGASVYSRNRFLPNWTSTLRIGRGTDDSRQFSNGVQTGKIRTDQDQVQWQNDLTLPVGQALVAVESLKQKVSGDTAYTVKERHNDSYLLGWNGRLGDHRLQFNLRRDDNSQFGSKSTGFAAYGYQIDTAWRANISYGTAFRAPTFNDLYWPGAGNPNLRPETATNRELALHYEAGRHQASLTYYRNSIDDLIDWAPGPGGLWTPANVAKAELEGITLAYRGRVGNFGLQASLDVQDPRDKDLDKLLRYRSREHGNLTLSREYGAWQWQAELQASGKRYNDKANTQVLGGYTLLNLQGSYALSREWSVFGRANNLFDKKYVLVDTFATPGANLFVGIRYAPK